jgi:N-acyl-D-aspartate/D-glutamate deacylase
MPDVVIRAGRVLDGTGSDPVTADIAIRQGTIIEIGRVRDRAHRVIDADGALVTAGLCALLPPGEIALFERNRQHHLAPGVTTAIVAASDLPASELKNYLQSVGSQASVIDRAVLIDHTSLGLEVMGNKVRDGVDPSAGDLERMAYLVADGLKAGAVGLRSAGQGSPDELRNVIELATGRLLRETETWADYSLLLDGRLESEELLEIARHVVSTVTPTSILVSAPSPIEDPMVHTAVTPESEEDVADLFDHDQTVAGPGLNPLALLRHSTTDRLPPAHLGQCWAAMPAAFGLADRGTLQPALRADINVLDHASLSTDLSYGVISTLVHGTEIVSEDELTGDCPGTLATRQLGTVNR